MQGKICYYKYNPLVCNHLFAELFVSFQQNNFSILKLALRLLKLQSHHLPSPFADPRFCVFKSDIAHKWEGFYPTSYVFLSDRLVTQTYSGLVCTPHTQLLSLIIIVVGRAEATYMEILNVE